MAKILLRHVASSTGISYSLVKFLGFRGRSYPFRANPWESFDHKGSFLVSHLSMNYPNITKHTSPQVYPLSMPVKGVDGEI